MYSLEREMSPNASPVTLVKLPVTTTLQLLLLLGELCFAFSMLSTSQAADNQFLPDVLGTEPET